VAPHLCFNTWLNAGCIEGLQPPSNVRRHESGGGALAQVCLLVFVPHKAGCAGFVQFYRIGVFVLQFYSATFGLTFDAYTFRFVRLSQTLISLWLMVSSGLFRVFFFFRAAQPLSLISP
jgi:hypothetical protein